MVSELPLWLWTAGGGLLGLLIGSFLATLVLRWPRGEKLWGRSACDGCGVQLRAWQLVPILSYLIQRRRCPHCAAAIDWRHPAIEAGAALIGAAALFAEPGIVGLAGALFGWLLLALLALDAEHYWLPDALTMPLLGLGLLLGPGTLPGRLLAAAIGGGGLLLIALLYRVWRKREGLGLGDAKLMAALGAWLGLLTLPLLLLVAALLGLLVAICSGLRGRPVDRVPLGACLCATAFPLWLLGPGVWPIVGG